VPDPAMALAKILARLVKTTGASTCPASRTKVRPLTAEEKKSLAALPSSDELFANRPGCFLGPQLLGGRPRLGDELAAAVARHPMPSRQLPKGRAQHHRRERVGARRRPHGLPDMT